MEAGKASRVIGLHEKSKDMPPRASDKPRARRSSWIRAALTMMLSAYWLLMFTGTHIPELPDGIEVISDKLLHFCAYFGLSVLFVVWQSIRGTVGWRTILGIWFVIAAYGVFDEFTQQFFGRDMEAADWLADVSGVTVGLVITWPTVPRILRWYRASRA